ncbi:hypothetical protein [Methylobacterium sp. Leaf87]|uniref:hypothetical protein n=1 Tax=Methylobacterium sp. Leaf87 TaxID=1736243 RepID=UPI001FCD38D0|nr:hypothetical protein [Methylobacterium sp. Leaf87]USU34147.1 hypothetical protein NG677_11035 [Methylobacterium sp. OTU13CASTA1]
MYPTSLPSFEYRLAELGRSFLVPLDMPVDWAEVSHRRVREARRLYDDVEGSGPA